MGLRQRQWALRETLRLKAVLGSKCRACGSQVNLEFDCRSPKGSAHHRCEYSMRISFYRAQHRVGNLQILCQKCNALKAGFSLAIWETAVMCLAKTEAEQPRCFSGGRGTAFTDEERRSFLRDQLYPQMPEVAACPY
jgi:hypothetical protein